MNGSTQRPTRLAVVANPISGGGRASTLVPRLVAALRARGVDAEARFTTFAGEATQHAATALQQGFGGVIAVGGDGTVNEVLNGLSGSRVPLGMLPVGTANVLACELRLPRDPDRAADVIASGSTRELAIGAATCAASASASASCRRFLLFCGAGVDGDVVRNLTRARTGTLGKRKWTKPILTTVWRWPRFDLRATFADGSSLDGLGSVLVTRVRNYGGLLQLTPDVDAGDGQLHVLCFRMHSRTAFAWQGLRAFLHRMRASKSLLVRTTTAVRIEGSAPFHLDGDDCGDAPVDVALAGSVRVFAPR